MKTIRFFILALFLAITAAASTREFNDYDFEQEKMFCTEDGIYLVSTFENQDKVSAYSYLGHKMWEKAFFAKITSWQIVNNYLIVFSKDRNGYKTYLTCINRFSGDLLWQRP
ncbi:MAG: hypothetical protein K2P51_07995 [Rhabdochlamydiaceae bacterium]|nr:hypothetical protein [Rhabdochlamydiaceae bacterium]